MQLQLAWMNRELLQSRIVLHAAREWGNEKHKNPLGTNCGRWAARRSSSDSRDCSSRLASRRQFPTSHCSPRVLRHVLPEWGCGNSEIVGRPSRPTLIMQVAEDCSCRPARSIDGRGEACWIPHGWINRAAHAHQWGIRPCVSRTKQPTDSWQCRQYGTWLGTYSPTHIPRCKSLACHEQ